VNKIIVAVTFLSTMTLSSMANGHKISQCAYLAKAPGKVSSLDRCESCVNKSDTSVGATEEKIDKLIDECLRDVSLLRKGKS